MENIHSELTIQLKSLSSEIFSFFLRLNDSQTIFYRVKRFSILCNFFLLLLLLLVASGIVCLQFLYL